jgi:hypothetical protein
MEKYVISLIDGDCLCFESNKTKEQLITELSVLVKNARKQYNKTKKYDDQKFVFEGIKMEAILVSWGIQTLDEWFEDNKG